MEVDYSSLNLCRFYSFGYVSLLYCEDKMGNASTK